MSSECAGAGKCHGTLKWCASCGNVEHACDVRLEGKDCDEHPVPPEWNELKTRRRAAERRIADASAMARKANRELAAIAEDERARRIYSKQLEAQSEAAFASN